MHRQLSVQSGRSVDLRLQPVPSNRSDLLTPTKPAPGNPAVTPQDKQATDQLLKERPDLSLALQRLAGIDPEKRQQEYEAIRRELLRLSKHDPVSLELSTDGGGGATYLGPETPGEPAPAAEEPPAAKAVNAKKPDGTSPDGQAAPQAALLQVYQQVSRPEVPTSLLTSQVV